MTSHYQEPAAAQKYQDFLDSENGKIQQEVLLQAIARHVPAGARQLLDMACGPGWLAGALHKQPWNVRGCDASRPLIEAAQKKYPAVEFTIADAEKPLPYPELFFDCVICNMAGPDMADLYAAMKNGAAVLRRNCDFVMTVPNPYYTYPVAAWKKTIEGMLRGGKPRLTIAQPYFRHGKNRRVEREFKKGERISSFAYTLSDYLSAAEAAGLTLSGMEEITSATDSPRFDLRHQLYRYPLLLLLKFTKTAAR